MEHGFGCPYVARLHPQIAQIEERHATWAAGVRLGADTKGRYARLAAGCYPDGRPEIVEIAAATMEWMFATDDQVFDERADSDDPWPPARCAAHLAHLVHEPHSNAVRPGKAIRPLYTALRTTAARLRALASPVQYERWATGVREWLFGKLAITATPPYAAPDDYRAVRELAAGMVMYLALVDLAAGTELPAADWCRPDVVKHTRLAAQIVALTNDVFSAPKEAVQSVRSVNLPTSFMHQQDVPLERGQELTGQLVAGLYMGFIRTDAELRRNASTELAIYLDGLKEWLAGHHAWYGVTSRYQSGGT